MSVSAEVLLWGRRIGVVALADGQSVASFEYDHEFLESRIQPSPIVMPLAGRVFSFPELSNESFHGLPGLLADSLPDKFGNAVIDAWLDAQGRPRGSMNAIERLCYTGMRGMGALEYQPALGPAYSATDELDLVQLTKLAQSILAQRQELHAPADTDGLEQIIRIGTSAGGARAKALVAWNEQTQELRSGQVDSGPGFTQWLLKFDGIAANADKEDADAPCYTRIEYAYYLMAREAGIAMSECRLLEEGNRRHFMTKRFDRTSNGNKLHMQSGGALAHFDFNVAGAHSYEETADVMRRIGLGQGEVDELYRRMVFNVLARNQDDHVKNIAFLMDRSGRWSLAPAFDMTYAYKPGGAWTGSHQMRVNGKRDDISHDDLLACARHISLREHKATTIIEGVRSAVAQWSSFAQTAEVPEQQAVAIAQELLI
ncbi:MAG: type II toxin-antitoxin system HipA family toxin [Eggerthellaceae bacterium]|nr:type II toxin-antitoxin system HipA family toxin [Eggerthellaceae bacterium]